MAQNKILPWAQTSTANALSDADYAADVATGGSYADGVKSGQASSKQANKTWRQATAPGSGLAQFLVDNLSVDVTDADTPDTFSTRIANAVLKLAQISPFNQSWATATGGYRKYAIVSDSSGNFWVSTADQNTTTPGANGAKWQNLFNGYATQSWANSAFVKNNAGTQGGIVALDLDIDGSGRAAFQKTDGSWGILQPAGDYATNAALTAETNRATTAESNLQSSKANLSGGNNLDGAQTINHGNLTLAGDTNTPNNSRQVIIQRGDSWRYAFDYSHDNDHGNYSRWIFYDANTQNVKDILYYFLDRGRLSSSMHGDYALVSDFGVSLASNGYQKLPGGLIVQWGVISSSNGTFNFPITFPTACFFVLPGNTNSQGDMVDNAYAYPINQSQFFAATKESQINAISNFALAWIAFGY